MTGIGIDTTQNVHIELPLASVGHRILSTLIDGALLLCYWGVGLFIGMRFSSLVNHQAGFVAVILFLLPMIFYSLIFESMMNGQTIGKKIMKIHVANLDGTPLRLSSLLIRWMFRFIDVTLTNGVCAVLTVVIGGKGQRLGDILAKTVVVRSNSKVKLETSFSERVADDYEIVFPQVEFLSDNDIRLINKVLDQMAMIKDDVQRMLFGIKARKKIAEKLKITTEMKPEEFLTTLIKDYSAMFQDK